MPHSGIFSLTVDFAKLSLVFLKRSDALKLEYNQTISVVYCCKSPQHAWNIPRKPRSS